MGNRRRGGGKRGLVLAGLLASLAWSAALGANFAIERVSVTPGGAQLTTSSTGPSVSANGRYVAFSSFAGNLVVGDTNNANDVFVRDLSTGATERVSVTPGGGNGNNSTNEGTAITPDGQQVFFASTASNLSPGDTNGAYDIFVRNRALGTTERVSVALDGGFPDSDSRDDLTVSADGRFVAFTSNASNLVAGDTNGRLDVFVRDRLLGFTERVSVASNGSQANEGRSEQSAMSADGRFVTFTSEAANLVPGDTNGTWDVFVRDRQLGTTERISVSSWGEEANGPSEAPAISGNGRFITFRTLATNFVAGDVNDKYNFFVHDRLNHTTSLVDVTPFGHVGNGDAEAVAAVSADGRYVAFASSSSLVAVDAGPPQVYVRDLYAGATVRVSQALDGTPANGKSYLPALSPEGDVVAFISVANNLVPNDTNGFSDVFAAVNPLYNAPPDVQADKTLTLLEDAVSPSLEVALPTDQEGDPLTVLVEEVPAPEKGVVRLPGGPALTAGQSLTPAQLPLLVFDPVANANGGAGDFAYSVADDHSGVSGQTVTLQITPVNDAPVSQGQTVLLSEDTPTYVTLTGYDVDGDPLTYSVVQGPQHGTLGGADATRLYHPAANYYGGDSFTFRISDGQTLSSVETIHLSVIAVNDPPMANAGTNRTVEATGPLTSVTLNGAASSDVDGEALTYRWTWHGMEVGTTASPTVNLPLGQHVLNLTVTDLQHADSSDDVLIVVEDTTPPLLSVPENRTVTQTGVGGTLVIFTPTATDLVSEVTVASDPPSGSVFPVGQTTVHVTATDASGNQATGTFTVTVTTPTSTPGQVTAKGAILVSGKNAKFHLTAKQVAGKPLKGSLSFTDPVTRQTVKSTKLTAVLIVGNRAQVFGEGKIKKTAVRFLAEVEDLGTGRGADRFRLELSDGRVFGAANLRSGSVTIRQ
jgi:hypothetical protein